MQIPTHPKYDISKDGAVSLISSGLMLPVKVRKSNRKAVQLRNDNYTKTYHNLDRLLLKTFKPAPENTDDNWLSVKYADGNFENTSIDNVDWSDEWYNAPSFQRDPGDGWDEYPIPGYPDLRVHPEEDDILIYNDRTRHWYSPSVGSHGYLEINVPVHGTLTVHRLIALVLLDHPLDTDHLVVNHKDSDKLNNDPSNLEWTTYSGNNQHAYDDGTRNHLTKRVVTMNKETAGTVIHASIQRAARFLGTNPGIVHEVLSRVRNKAVGYKGFFVKYEDDPTSWEEIASDNKKNQEAYTIAVKDMRSGEVIVYNSLMSTIRAENINAKTLYRLLLSNPPVPWNGKCFQPHTQEEMKWPDYPEEILAVYSRSHNGGRPFKVTHKDGGVEYWPTLGSWCEYDRSNRCDGAVLSREIKKHGKWRDWVFEYVDLNKYI